MTQSTTQTEATAPTGDIKVFIDAFNKDFDIEFKSLSDKLNNLKNVYNDAIKITTPRTSTWPKDENVKTIGDLFKYTFPDIEKGTFIKPPSGIESNGVSSYVDDNKVADYNSWEKDLTSTETISQMFSYLRNNIRGIDKLNKLNQVKKPGVTNPNLYSPGQYYFDVFMSLMLSDSGPIKKPSDGNGGSNVFDSEYLKTNGTASISIFDPSGEVEISKHTSNEKFDYYEFYEIISSGYSGVGIKYRMIETTGISIDLDGDSIYGISVFPSLRVQYRSGNLSELEKDPKFNESRGEVSSTNPSEFIGNYEQLLLYKAFVQAGDNYKPIVLPYEKVEPETQDPIKEAPTSLPVSEPIVDEFIFNVERVDTFVIVGGSQSGFELVIVPNDGFVDVFNDNTNYTDDYEELDEEYGEDLFSGFDENIVYLEPTSYKSGYTPTSDDKQSTVTDVESLDGPIEIPKPKEGEMTISKQGLKKLKAHEGSRQTVYDDKTGKSISSWSQCKGFPTIGVGHLINKNEYSIFSKYLSPGQMSEAQVENLLLKDLSSRIEGLNKKLKVQVTQGQFDALLSMGFNTGFGAKSFLKAVELTNQGNKSGAAAQIKSGPITSKGKIVDGLVRRRNDESEWYLRTDLA